MGDGSVWADFGDSVAVAIWRWTIGGFGDGFLFPRGPFLRRQESHSVVHATIGKNPPFRRQLTPPLAAYDCEIPAYAGMVCLCTDDCGRIWRCLWYDTVRFLPSQEWSCGGRGIVGGFWRLCVRQFGGSCRFAIMRFLPSQEWSRGRAAVSPIPPVSVKLNAIPNNRKYRQ